MKTIINVLNIFVTAPIWYYLMYNILLRVNATELMMFLFWVYVPISLIIKIAVEIAFNVKKQNVT